MNLLSVAIAEDGYSISWLTHHMIEQMMTVQLSLEVARALDLG